MAFLLGLVSALASACCTLPAVGMLIAYSGSRPSVERRSTIWSAAGFLLGTSVSLIIMGFIAALLGQTAQVFLGRYWKLVAGLLAVVLGLGSLRWIPLPSFAWNRTSADQPVAPRSLLGDMLGGLLLGGGVAACSLPCNPGIFIVLGASVLLGRIAWGMILMAAYGIGFGLPLSAIVFGISLGKTLVRAANVESLIRTLAGGALMVAGFYLLWSF